MGMFDFFKRRRERESAIPGGSPESLTRQLKGDGKPIGQPVGQQFPQANQSFDVTGAGDIAGLMTVLQQAFQSGNYQVTQGENQVIDLRGSGLREQILGALEQHGIDPDTAQGGQIDAGQVPGLQEQIMQALNEAGVDLGDGAGGITIEGGGFDSGSSGDFGGSDSSGGDSGGGDSGGGDSGGGGGGD
jgi:hypothetical protein